MSPRIGYYVHHQGDGHRQRALCIADALDEPVLLIGTGLAGRTGAHPCLDLPDDSLAPGFAGEDGLAERPEALHYAPYHHDGVRARVRMLTQWIAEARPALLVVDVSAEVAMLARLAATPVLYVRLNGARTDPAHLDAFRGARALLAPFAAALEDAATPDWVRRKTGYVPGLAPPPFAAPSRPGRVLVIQGRGGPAGCGERLAAAARATPRLDWRAIGPVGRPACPPANLCLAGWSEDPAREIAEAAVVVGGAGDGTVNAVLAAGRPFICLPEPRAYDEQASKACSLSRAGAAVVLSDWPEPVAWEGLIVQALALCPDRQAALHDADGPARAARLIQHCLDGPGGPGGSRPC